MLVHGALLRVHHDNAYGGPGQENVTVEWSRYLGALEFGLNIEVGALGLRLGAGTGLVHDTDTVGTEGGPVASIAASARVSGPVRIQVEAMRWFIASNGDVNTGATIVSVGAGVSF